MNNIQNEPLFCSPEPIRLLCLGDSLTDGFWLPGGYRNTLCRLLSENGLSSAVQFLGINESGTGYDTHHAGFSSFATVDIAESVTGGRRGITGMLDEVLQCGAPDVVFLQIGTNDILSLYELDRFRFRLAAICERLLRGMRADGMLYLGQLAPLDANDQTFIDPRFFTQESTDAAVAECNRQIAETAAKLSAEGKPVILADAGSILTKADLHDGVHPTAEGYEKLGLFWFSTLAKELNRRRMLSLTGLVAGKRA